MPPLHCIISASDKDLRHYLIILQRTTWQDIKTSQQGKASRSTNRVLAQSEVTKHQKRPTEAHEVIIRIPEE